MSKYIYDENVFLKIDNFDNIYSQNKYESYSISPQNKKVKGMIIRTFSPLYFKEIMDYLHNLSL